MIAKFTFNYNGGFEKKENAVFQQGSIGVDSYQVFAPFLTTTQVYIKTKRNGDLEFSLWKQLDYNSTIGGWLKTATQDELLVDGEMKVVFKFNNLVSQETSLWVRKGTLIVPEMTTYEALRDYVENQEIRIDQIINGTTDIAFDKTGTNLNSDFVEEAIKEVNDKSDANKQDIIDMKNGIDAFTEILLSDGNGGTLRVTYDGKDPIFTYRGLSAEMFKNLFGEAEPASGVTFTHGMPIMYAGSIGNSGKRLAKPTVLSELAVNPNLFLGIVTEVTPEGHAIYNWYGVVNQLNTSGLTLGAPLYVGNGVMVATKPTKPLPTIKIGLVERVSATVGQVSVRPDIGRYLGDLHNVYVNGSEVDGITIMYNGTTNRYEAYDLKGNVLRIDGEIAKIKDGTTIVKKAEQDKNSNDIVNTYETKSVVSEINNRVTSLETANMIKSYTYNPSTHVLTFTYFDNTTTSLDLPLESAIVDASYDNVTKDITFTLQSGATLVVPLDDLVSGLASETWVNTYFIPKTALKTSFSATPLDTNVISEKLAKDSLDLKEALANKAIDFSVLNDTKYPTTKAVAERLLNLPITELNNHTLREVFEGGNSLVNNKYPFINTVNWSSSRGALSNVNSYLIGNQIIGDGFANMLLIQSDKTFNNGDVTYTNIKATNLIGMLQNNGGATPNLIKNGDTYSGKITYVSNYTNFIVYLNFLNDIDNTTSQIYHLYNINQTSLGISSLTVSQMDYWFNVYQALLVSDTNVFSIIQNYASKTLEAWLTPTLTSATSTYIRYRKDTLGTVIVEGNITVTTAGTNLTLPVGYRPLFAYTVGILTFNTNGTVVSSATGTQTLSVRYTGA